MKIAFLNIYNGIIDRGSEVFVDEIAEQLALKHTICVFQSGSPKKTNYKTQQIRGIPYISTQGLLYHLLVMIFTIRCFSFLVKDDYDWVIPINGRFQPLICRFLRLVKKSRILITGHAGVGREDMLNMLLGKPDIFVALSPKAYNWAKKFISRVEYIPNGVNLERFQPQTKEIELSFKGSIVFCNSALLPYKRIEHVIKAVSTLPGVNLLLVGNGPLKKDIDNLGIDLLGKRFRHIDSVPYKDIPAYYNASNVFTLPSEESEAFGLVYLEAMACNIPIVAPDDINRREIIGDAGLFYESGNSKDYAITLKKALQINWGDKPRKQAEKFSWKIIAQRYEEILKKS